MNASENPGKKEQAQNQIDQALELVRRPPQRPRDGFWYFVSSGFFFMTVGALTLFFAYSTLYATHSSLTFVLVVVGVAMLLYGTGTQGVGNFENSVGEARYKIGVAGGAGILAFCVGLGIVVQADAIKNAFQIEKNYLRLYLTADNDGVSSFEDYVPEVSANGIAAPVQRNGSGFVVYLPYFGTGRDTEIKLTARFHYVGPEYRRNKSLHRNAVFDETLTITRVVDDGSLDFPRYPDELPVTLARNERPDDSIPEEIGGGNAPPPALVTPQ